MKRIREMPQSEKPREKALRYGVESLSNAELLALLLRTGTREMNVIMLAHTLLERFDGLAGLLHAPLSILKEVKGISDSKALEIMAVAEIGVRLAYEEMCQKDLIRNAREIAEWLRVKIGSDASEKFVVISLNIRHEVIGYRILFQGTIRESCVSNREIFQEALLKNAACIILAHNHPSQNVTPSKADYRMTESSCRAGILCGIPVLDHVIVSAHSYFSFAESGFIKNIMEADLE